MSETIRNMDWEGIVDKTYRECSPLVDNESKFKKWMLEKEKLGRPFDSVLAGMCYRTAKKLKQDNDKVVVIVGREGSGKSTLSSQICAYVDPDFNISNVCFSELEFIQSLRSAVKGNAVSIDEGGLSLLSREAMTLGNRNMIKIFMTIRRKSLLCVICCPSYQDLDRYIRDHRVSLLINITSRGKYIAIHGSGLKKVNRDIGKTKSISAIQLPDGYFWNGYFNKSFPATVDYDAYLSKKDSHIDDSLAQMEEEASQREKSYVPKMIPSTKVARELGLTSEQLRYRIIRNTVSAKKIGNHWFVPKEEYERLISTDK